MAHNFLVQGLVPDGVRRVLVVIGTHRRAAVGVEENVFSVKAEQPIHVERLLSR